MSEVPNAMNQVEDPQPPLSLEEEIYIFIDGMSECVFEDGRYPNSSLNDLIHILETLDKERTKLQAQNKILLDGLRDVRDHAVNTISKPKVGTTWSIVDKAIKDSEAQS